MKLTNELPETIKIKVLEKDFKNVYYLSTKDCAIGRAIVRDLCLDPDPELALYGVGGSHVRFQDAFYDLPEKERNLVQKMCSGRVKPRNLTITLTLLKN